MLENDCPLDVTATVLGPDNLDVIAHCSQASTRLMMKSYNAGAAAHEAALEK
jgi:hypothetical protein